jgi:hypothetical protein
MRPRIASLFSSGPLPHILDILDSFISRPTNCRFAAPARPHNKHTPAPVRLVADNECCANILDRPGRREATVTAESEPVRRPR